MRTSRGLSAISIVFLFITLLSIILEAGLFVVRRRQEPDWEILNVSVADCEATEFLPTGSENEFEALAYDSYFSHAFDGFGAADSVTVHMARRSDDPTETVLYASGVLEGIRGEFVFALKQSGEDRFVADLGMEELDGIRIYPTEKVHTTVRFDGFTVNETVRHTDYSFGEAFLFWVLTAFILYVIVIVRAARNGTHTLSPWIGVTFGAGTLAAVAGLMASRLFSAAAAVGDILAVPAGLAAMAGVICIYIVSVIRPLHGKAAVLAALLALIFVFANAPLQAPDEYTHFMRAWTVSVGDFTFDNTRQFPADVLLLDDIFTGEFHNNIIKTGKGNALTGILSYLARVGGSEELPSYETHIQILGPYLLPGLFIAVGRLAGIKALGLMYLGRIANAAMYTAAVWYAVKKAKRYRPAVLAAAFWPLTVYMSASLSYDALYLSAFLVYLGSVFGEMETVRDRWVTVISFGILAAIKPTAAVLVLLLLLLPRESRRMSLGAISLLCGAALYFSVIGYAALVSKGMTAESLLPGVDVAAQIRYILSNPLRYLVIMLVDGYQNGFYAGRAGLFGWLDVETVLTPFLSLLGLLAVSVLGTREAGTGCGKWDSLWFALLCVLFYGITITGFYCECSTLGSSSILGVQARYLIPMIPCISALVSNGLDRLKIRVETEGAYADRVALWTCAGVSLVAAAELMLNYFLM